MNEVIISGKRYSTDGAKVLCIAEAMNLKTTLYHTERGAFFTVERSEFAADKWTVLTEDEARAFMDNHPSGIDTAAYIEVFGMPEDA